VHTAFLDFLTTVGLSQQTVQCLMSAYGIEDFAGIEDVLGLRTLLGLRSVSYVRLCAR